MLSSPINFLRHFLRKYNHNNIRLMSNTAIQNQELELENKKDNVVIQKLKELNDWYIKFTGLDEIKRLQDRVILTQEKLEKAQDERREVGQLLMQMRKKSSELQEQLHTINRWENVQKFLDLTKRETEVLKLEKDLSVQFEVLDKTEREIFTALSNAVRDSHEKEKAQAQYTKYWGIILSIIGTIVGAFVSTIVSSIRNKQIAKGITEEVEEKFNQLAGIVKVNKNEQSVESLVTNIVNNNNKSSKIIIDKLNDTQKQLNEILKINHAKHLLFSDENKQNNQILNANAFLTAQINLLEEHQNEIKNLVNHRSGGIFGENRLSWYLLGGVLLFFIFTNSR